MSFSYIGFNLFSYQKYLILFLLTTAGWIWVNGGFQINGASKKVEEEENEEEETPEPLRNFTLKQLRCFDGSTNENTGEEKPVYLSLGGVVFDVSKGRDFYGPGGPYEIFAGRECGVALAKMSFDESLLDDVGACESLGVGDKNELDGWLEKFEHFRCYPIKGRLVPDDNLPSPDKVISVDELLKFNGLIEGIPEGEYKCYATHPIYLGAGDFVFDVSFGGVSMYGKGGPYQRFAGKDASRALALMSFDVKDLENTDTSDLDEKQLKVLSDWVDNFKKKKGYPVVGRLNKKV